MATVDSLDIKIQSEAKSAEKALDSLIKKLNSVTSAMSKALNNKGLDGLGKSMESASAKMGSLKKDMKDISKNIEEPIKKASDSISKLSEKYKDLGKDFQFFGNEKETESALKKYRNLLEKAKLDEEKIRLGEGVEAPKYEKTYANLKQIENIVDSLQKKLYAIKPPEIKIPASNIPYVEIASLNDEQFEDFLKTLPSIQEKAKEAEEVIRGIGETAVDSAREFTGAWNGVELPDFLVEGKSAVPQIDTESLGSAEEKIKDSGKRIKETIGEIAEKINEVSNSIQDNSSLEIDIEGTESIKEKLESVIEDVQSIRDAGETVGLGKSLQGAFASMAHGIASSTELIGQKIRNFKAELQGMRDSGETIGFGKSFLDAITPVKTFDTIKDKISSLKSAFAGLRKEKVFEEASSGAQEAEIAIENVSQKVQKVSKAMGLASMSAEEFDSYLEKLTVPDVLETDLGKLNTKLKAAQQTLEELKSKAINFQLLPGNGTDFNSEGFRKIQAEITKTEKTIDLLTGKIREISEASERAATESAEIFRSNLANLQIPEIQTNSLEKLEKELQKAESDLDKFKAKLENDITMGRITADFGDAGYQKAAEQIALTEKQIEAIKEKMKTADSSARQTGGYSKLSQAMSSLSAMASRLGNALSKVAAHVQNFAKSIGKLAASGLKSIGNGIKSLVSNLAKLPKVLASMTKSVKGSDKSFKDNLKTILKYMFGIKALTALIRKMANYMKEGMDNLVQYSSEVNHSVSLMTSGLLSLKNGLAVAFAPIVNVVAPYIDKLVDLLLSATNAVGRFFAALTGKTVATQAKKVYQDYAESLNGVADAAKDAAKAIGTIGIDELNILSENKDDKDGGVSIEDMFEDVAIEKDIADWAKRIRDAFLSQDWEGLGATIAELLNKGLQKIYDIINWDNVGAKITEFVDAITRTFNSLVDTFDWDLLGRTIGAGINTLVNTFNMLLEGINFENLGRKLSEGLRGMIAEVDWQNLGNLIGNYFMVAWRLFEGFLDGMWKENSLTGLNGFQELGISLAEGIYGIFEKIDLGRIGAAISSIFNGIFETMQSFVDEMESKGTWQKIADNISHGLNNAISGIKPVEAARALGQFVTDLLGTMLSVAETTPWNELGHKIGQFLINIPWSTIFWQVFDIIANVLGGLFGGLATEILYNFDKIGTALADGFNEAFQRLKAFTLSVDWNSIAENIYIGLNNMIHGIDWASAGATLSDFVMKLLGVFREVAEKTDWEGLGRGIGEFLSNIDWGGILGAVFDVIWNVLSGLISGLLDTKAGKVIVAVTAGIATLEGLFKGVKIISAAMGLFKNLQSIFDLISGLFSPTGLIIGAIVAAAVLIIANWDKIKDAAMNLWKNVIEPFANFLKDIFASIWKDILSPAISYLAENIFPKLADTMENLWDNVMVPLGEFVSDVLAPIFEVLIDVLTVLWKNVVVPVGEAIGGILGAAFELLWTILNNLVIPVLSKIIDVLKILWDNLLKPIVEWVRDTLGPILETVFEAVGGVISTLINILSGLVTFLSGVLEGCGDILSNLINTVGEILGNLGDIFSGVIDFITGVFTGDWEKAWDGVLSIFKGVFNMIPTIAEGVINHVIGLINGIIGGINKVINLIPGDLIPKIPDIKKVSLPRFAVGGFPEDGLFFANHNELVGQFTNGQTAVANNAQIVEGIKYGVREAVAEVLAPYLADIAQNTRETADKDMSVRIGDRDIVSAYNRGSARQGYSFSS